MNSREWVSLMGFTVLLCACSKSVEAAPRDVQFRSINLQTGVIELFNFGFTDEPLDGWRFCTHNTTSALLYSLFDGFDGMTIESGTSFFIHTQNDLGAEDADNINLSTVAPIRFHFAMPMTNVAFGLQIYFPPTAFANGNQIADHVQWSLGGVDNTTADGRSCEAENGGVWMDQNAWIVTASTTNRIQLIDNTGSVLQGPGDYTTFNGPQPVFNRGDANDDGTVDIRDAMTIFFNLFAGSPALTCDEAADVNNNATIDIQDGIDVVVYLFLAGPPPVDPGPAGCGTDPDEPAGIGDIGCHDYTNC